MVRKSYAKVNIFLKIAGLRANYHELVSRFVKVHSLYDEISFKEESCENFTLIGNFGCETKKNTIYKVYELLKDLSPKVEKYFKNHSVRVDKNIPEFAGLGGGSSNCATFMLMVNEVCTLNLSKDELSEIGLLIGADVPFFVYEYDSANVTGIGEIVKKFEEDIFSLSIMTPKIECNTGQIFRKFDESFYKEISFKDKSRLLNLKSKEILDILTTTEANDLYESAVSVYPELVEYNKNDWYFSGSGSSFFKVNNE